MAVGVTPARPVALAPERVLHRLEWQVLRRLDGMLQGGHRTLHRGAGADFHDIRDYVPGDDVRHIDWNVTARTSELHVRQYTEERELTAWLLLDRSPSMAFGPVQRPKSLVLCELAGSIARLLVRGGDKVGALLYADGLERTIPPRSGRRQVLAVIRELLKPAPPARGRTDLAGLLSLGHRVIRRRSLVVVVSDFQSEPGWDVALGRLARRHEVVAIRLVDRRERELPDAGLIVVEDAETGEQLTVDASDPELRRRLRAVHAAHDQRVAQAVRRAGVELHDVSTDDDLLGVLLRLARSGRRSG